MEIVNTLEKESVIEQLFSRFKTPQDIEAQFEQSADCNVLFVTPTLTAENFYRVILPFLHLPTVSQGNIATAMFGISAHNPKQIYEKRITQGLTSSHAQWADVIIFPFTTQALRANAYDYIRVVNPECKIIYNLDYNIFHIPVKHPLYATMNSDKMRDIDDNIIYADLTVVDNEHLQQYLLNKHFSDVQKYKDITEDTKIGGIEVLPLLGYYDSMYGRVQAQRSDETKLRIGIPVSDNQSEELKQALQYFSEVITKFPGKTELIILGGYKDDKAFMEATQDVTFTHLPPRPLNDYYSTLLDSGIDIFIYLSKESFFHKTSDDIKRIIDFGLLGIPCIIPKYSSCATQVRHNSNGFVLEKPKFLPQIIENILINPTLLERASTGAFETTVRQHTYHNMQQLERMVYLLTYIGTK